MLVFVIGMIASMIFGACVMFAVLDIYMLERKVKRLKAKLKKLEKGDEPEVVQIIDITPEKES